MLFRSVEPLRFRRGQGWSRKVSVSDMEFNKVDVIDHQQQKVIQSPSTGSVLVNAGPGSGKTLVSALRLVELVKRGIEPSQILVLSFSRSAVATLSSRIKKLNISEDLAEELRYLSIRTFDAWAFRMLRLAGTPSNELLRNSHDENIRLLTDMFVDDGCSELHRRLQNIRHVIVDEFQDLPGVRADMVLALLSRLDMLSVGKIGFTVLGDPAQAIFSFAACNQENVPADDPWKSLRARFKSSLDEVELNHNYRSLPELSETFCRLRLMLRDGELPPEEKLREVKTYLESLPDSGIEGKIGPDWLAELPEGSVAILLRSNAEALRVATMLYGRDNVPAVSIKLRLAGLKDNPVPIWVGALMAPITIERMTRTWFDSLYRGVVNRVAAEVVSNVGLPEPNIAWRCLQAVVGGEAADTFIDVNKLRERLSWPDVFPTDAVTNQKKAVYVTTIHQSKGMEFDHVALLHSDVADNLPKNPLEEANVGFVAVTRAGRSLITLANDVIWRPFSQVELAGNRKRLKTWFSGWVNLQIGLPGDIDPTSFVSEQLHGSHSSVASVQETLLTHGDSLTGRKVLLKKAILQDHKVVYDILLLNDDGKELLIGRTSSQLTFDLLKLLGKGYSLPSKIMNVRIADVRTLTTSAILPDDVPTPWRKSRVWLGVSLFCTADFKPFKKNN